MARVSMSMSLAVCVAVVLAGLALTELGATRTLAARSSTRARPAFEVASVKVTRSGGVTAGPLLMRTRRGPGAPGELCTPFCPDAEGDAAELRAMKQGEASLKRYVDILARGISLASLATELAPSQRRPVIDRTGLSGRFDVELMWTPEAFSAATLAQRPGATPPPGVDPSGPPLPTALQDQLGLKFDSTRAAVEVLVIDRGEPLTATD